MSRLSLDRRRFLKAMGGLTLALPFHRMLERSAAGATSYPLRLLTIFNPHGTWLPFWRPQGSGTNFTLQYNGSILAALEPFKSKLVVIDGLDHRIAYESGGIGHGAGAVVPFTGASAIPNSDKAAGPSVDFYLASRLGGSTPVRLLNLSVGTTATFSFNDSGIRAPGMADPLDAYNTVFGGGLPAVSSDPVAAAAAMRVQQQRLGVLTALENEVNINSARLRLAAPEKAKLDEHLAALKDLEMRIRGASAAGQATACHAPMASARLANPTDPQVIPQVSRNHLDIIAQAFACDITRFATLNYYQAGTGETMPFCGVNKDTHLDVAHQVSDSNPGAVQDLVKLHQWFTGEVAYLLGKLDGIAEGDGTVLDHTLIVWSTELGNPAVHDHFNVPFVLAGKANGKIKTGQYLQENPIGGYSCSSVPAQNQPPGGCTSPFAHLDAHNRLLTAICQAFGQQIDYFNASQWTGALPGLLA